VRREILTDPAPPAPCPAEPCTAAGARRAPRIGYLPWAGITNPYAARFIEILGALGTVSALPSPGELLRRPWRLRRQFDVALVNWIEFDLVRRRDGALSAAGLARLLARVLLLRCVARRVVYVRHNNFPHGTRERDRERAQHALDRLERLFDAVLIHAGHAPAPHRRYVPHPLYRAAESGLAADEARLVATLPARYYAVFGRIARYKGIDRLLAHFPRERSLVVLGAVEEPDHAAELERLAGPNVRILAGHVSDALAQAVVRASCGLVLSHAERDMIVSGSLFYALSLGTRVFAIENPALAWLRARIGPAHLHLASNVAALCAQLARDRGAPAADPVRAPRIAAEFGDARIAGVLREVLLP
jgi:glycosyltransferase involved in cell wall biosynthesis